MYIVDKNCNEKPTFKDLEEALIEATKYAKKFWREILVSKAIDKTEAVGIFLVGSYYIRYLNDTKVDEFYIKDALDPNNICLRSEIYDEKEAKEAARELAKDYGMVELRAYYQSQREGLVSLFKKEGNEVIEIENIPVSYFLMDENDKLLNVDYRDLEEARKAARKYAEERGEASLYEILDDGTERMVAWFKNRGEAVFEYRGKE